MYVSLYYCFQLTDFTQSIAITMHMAHVSVAIACNVRTILEFGWLQYLGVYRYISTYFEKKIWKLTAMVLFYFLSGYMLLFLTVLQTLAHFCSHLLITKIASSILLVLIILAITSVGGYVVHIGEIPSYLWWSETFSPQRWLLPVIISNEFTQETLANTAGQQLCRNKHVSSMKSIKFLTGN